MFISAAFLPGPSQHASVREIRTQSASPSFQFSPKAGFIRQAFFRSARMWPIIPTSACSS